MHALVAVVDAGSFVRAADASGRSKASVSRQVAELEARLGVRLLQRTTRRLSLTPAGELYVARCRELLATLAEAEAEVGAHGGEAVGLLRISAPVSFGVRHLAPLWATFMRAHPRVQLEVTLSDRMVDLVEEGVDLAVRIARLPSSSLVSRRLATMRLVLCAAPAYLAERGVPRTPEDLAEHDVVGYSLSATGDAWSFDGPQGPISVTVRPRLRTNSGDTCRAVALGGLGLIAQPSFLVADDLAAGTLVEVLPQYRPQPFGIYAVFPTRKHLAPKLRLLIDFLAEALCRPS